MNAVVASLKPGDSLLFRRGSKWDRNVLRINGIEGTENHPITIGAFGPEKEPRPSIAHGGISVRNTKYLVIQSMQVHHNLSGPCIAVDRSSYITAIDNWIHHSKSNGIAYHAFVHRTVTADNIIHDVLANDGISVHDSGQWAKEPGPAGPHHWIIDNLLPGNYEEDGIDVATEDNPNGSAAQDVKIIGNRVLGAQLCGVVAQHQCRYIWVLGNTVIGCGRGGAKALSLGKKGENGDGWAKASGNLLVDNIRGVRLRDQADFRNNTIIHRSSEPALLLNSNAENMILKQNLVLTVGAPYVRVQKSLADLSQLSLDRDWYGAIPPASKRHKAPFFYQGKRSADEWQKRLGLDQNSDFGEPTGMRIDTKSTNVNEWGETFQAQFIPGDSWEGHGRHGGVGAFGPDGKRLGMEITVLPQLDIE